MAAIPILLGLCVSCNTNTTDCGTLPSSPQRPARSLRCRFPSFTPHPWRQLSCYFSRCPRVCAGVGLFV